MTGRKDRRLDRIDEVKRKMDWQIDENTLNIKLKETNVLLKTDFLTWNWDLIGELVEGPLANPVHFASATRQKFLKRIFNFLCPLNRSYSALPWTRVSLESINRSIDCPSFFLFLFLSLSFSLSL